MPFKTPLNSPLTESQNKALSKLNSLNVYVTAPKNPFQNLLKSQQISTFDLSTRFLDSISGPGVTEVVLQQFLRKIFATQGNDRFLLEDIIIKGLSKTLDTRGIQLSPKTKNKPLTDEQIIQNLTDSVEYNFLGKEENGFKFVEVSSNIPEKLPNLIVSTYSADTQSSIDEIKRRVNLDFNNSGYFNKENKVNYPPTGTLKSEVPNITGTIKGEVKTFTGNTFLSNSLIEIVGANPPISLFTDDVGKYEIKGLKAGNYVIKSSIDSYESEVKTVEVIQIQDSENILNFSLKNSTGKTNNYNTAQTQTNQTDSGETKNLKYEYNTIAEPLIYEFKEQKVPANATKAEDVTSLILTVTNNKNLPIATITIGPIDGEEFTDYQSLKDRYYEIVSDFSDSREVTYDGYVYPGRTENEYKFLVSNNAGLPTYEYVDSGDFSEERLKNSLNEERIISGITYPPEGAQFTSDSLFIPNSGNTNNINSNNITVGSVEADIDIDENLLISGLSGVSQDFRNDIVSTFTFSVNEDDIGLTNEQYLQKYLRPSLTTGKRVLASQIIKMIFGPKEIIHPDPEIQTKLLNAAACGEKMYSISNSVNVTEKELEFNRIELKKRLESGKVELIVSCQKVEISLPENFENEFDLLPSEEIGIPENQRPNPAESFLLLNNYVKSEMQRQRSEEDSNQVKQSFTQIIIEKTMQYISVALSVSPEMNQAFNVINSELIKTGQETITPKEILSSPCEICDACKSENKKDFEQKSAFSKSIINSLYSIVLSMLIRRLISDAKSKISKLIQEKAKEKILKLIRRQKERFAFLSKIENASQQISKATEYKEQLNSSGIKDIFNFNNENNT